MMRRLAAVIVLVMSLGVLTVSPVGAITGNYVADFEHPYVGLAVFYDENGEFLHRCSGSLLSPSVFLTAGHCVEGATSARIYFQQDAGANYDPETELDPVSGYPEYCADGTLGVTCATSDELYNYGFTDLTDITNVDIHDVGLIILDQPITLAEYGSLAAPGTLDGLATRRGLQDLTITVSGYGVSRTNPVQYESYRVRLMATEQLLNLRSAVVGATTLQTTANPGGGKGGTCGGDSGGPVFLGEASSNTIVAVTSWGFGQNCRGVDFSYRVDTQAVLDWILETVADSSQPGEVDNIQVVTP